MFFGDKWGFYHLRNAIKLVDIGPNDEDIVINMLCEQPLNDFDLFWIGACDVRSDLFSRQPDTFEPVFLSWGHAARDS